MALGIVPFEHGHLKEAAAMFVTSFEALRRDVPALPGEFADVDAVARRLAEMTGVAALQGGHLVGYLTSWFPIEGFRGTDRRGAYVPEWAHGAHGSDRAAVSRALYRAASAGWAASGCGVHAITLLARDDASLDTWFWNGFGMGTVDGVRPMTPLEAPVPDGVTVRLGTDDDATALESLDLEHNRHYAEPPVFMAPRTGDDAGVWSSFLQRPGNTAWLVEDRSGPFGFMRFDREFGGSDVVESKDGVFISGAYVRASHRGRGSAAAMLDAALRHYRDLGLAYCALDFEAFNPEAATFWMRHFTPVCYSLMRIPEVVRPS